MKLSRNVIVGLVLTAFGAVVAIASLQFELMNQFGPGPGLFPFLLGCLLVLLSLLYTLVEYVAFRKDKAAGKVKEEEPLFTRPKIVFACLGIVLLVAFLMEKLGFLLSVAIGVSLFPKMVKPDWPWKKAIALGLITGTVIYCLFKFVLGVYLPMGVLPL